jgi:hypothetical protein
VHQAAEGSVMSVATPAVNRDPSCSYVAMARSSIQMYDPSICGILNYKTAVLESER